MVQGPLHSPTADDFDDDALLLSRTEHPSLTRAAASSSRNPKLKAAADDDGAACRPAARPRHPIPKRGGSGPFSGTLTPGGQRPPRSNEPAPVRSNPEDWNTFDLSSLPIQGVKDEKDYTKLVVHWCVAARRPRSQPVAVRRSPRRRHAAATRRHHMPPYATTGRRHTPPPTPRSPLVQDPSVRDEHTGP